MEKAQRHFNEERLARLEIGKTLRGRACVIGGSAWSMAQAAGLGDAATKLEGSSYSSAGRARSQFAGWQGVG